MQAPTSATTSPFRSNPARRARRRPRPVILERVHQIVARQAERRRDPEEQAGDDRGRERGQQHRDVDAHVRVDAERRRHESEERRYAPIGKQHPDCRTGDRQDDALGQKLADDPHASGAERRAHRHLAASS